MPYCNDKADIRRTTQLYLRVNQWGLIHKNVTEELNNALIVERYMYIDSEKETWKIYLKSFLLWYTFSIYYFSYNSGFVMDIRKGDMCNNNF